MKIFCVTFYEPMTYSTTLIVKAESLKDSKEKVIIKQNIKNPKNFIWKINEISDGANFDEDGFYLYEIL